jgi:hypothetical protein
LPAIRYNEPAGHGFDAGLNGFSALVIVQYDAIEPVSGWKPKGSETMAPTSLSSTERINSALQDWRTGDHNKALNALLAAARDNIDGAASLLLQFSAQTRCSLTKRKKIAATIQKAPRTSAGQRHLAFMSASGFADPANAGSAVRQRLSDASDGDLQALVEIGLLMHMSDEQHHGDIILEHAAYRGSGHAIAALLRRSLQAGKISSLARQKADDLARTPHPLARQLVSETAALTVRTPICDYQTCPPLFLKASQTAFASHKSSSAKHSAFHPRSSVGRMHSRKSFVTIWQRGLLHCSNLRKSLIPAWGVRGRTPTANPWWPPCPMASWIWYYGPSKIEWLVSLARPTHRVSLSRCSPIAPATITNLIMTILATMMG